MRLKFGIDVYNGGEWTMDRLRLGRTGRESGRQRSAGYVSNISSPNLDIRDHPENGITPIGGTFSLGRPAI